VPYTIQFPPAEPVTRIACTGTVTIADLVGATQGLYESPVWVPGADVVWDFTAVGMVLLDHGDLQSLPEVDEAYEDVAAGGRDVVVATRELDYDLARLYEKVAEGSVRVVSVVRSLGDAYAALAVPLPAGLP
jgi:hypothetical protein